MRFDCEIGLPPLPSNAVRRVVSAFVGNRKEGTRELSLAAKSVGFVLDGGRDAEIRVETILAAGPKTRGGMLVNTFEFRVGKDAEPMEGMVLLAQSPHGAVMMS